MSQLNQATNDGQLDYRDNEAYFEAAWIFNQDEYSRESFAAEFNEILTERVGENWRAWVSILPSATSQSL